MRHKRTGKKQSPWISCDLLSKIRRRDFLKKKAEQKGDQVSWTALKKVRNSVTLRLKARSVITLGEPSALNLWLKVNKLSLNVAKTEFMIVGSRHKLGAVADNHCINLNIEGKINKRVDHAKSLGLYIDKNLSWNKHIKEISKKCRMA